MAVLDRFAKVGEWVSKRDTAVAGMQRAAADLTPLDRPVPTGQLSSSVRSESQKRVDSDALDSVVNSTGAPSPRKTVP
jgi:hypothetical protein